MSKVTLAGARRSVALRPVTEVYLTGVLMILLAVRGVLTSAVAIFIFGIISLMILLIAVYAELLKVESMVNAQHDDLLNRIEGLLETLPSSPVEVPINTRTRRTR